MKSSYHLYSLHSGPGLPAMKFRMDYVKVMQNDNMYDSIFTIDNIVTV